MLKRITLENFFSFGEPTTIELNPGVNLLVGINGSGKSNFLKAIRLLHEAVAGKGLKELLLKEWGGLDVITNFSGGKSSTITLTYEFELTEKKFFIYKLIIRTFSNLEYFFDEILTTGSYEENDTADIKLIDVSGGTGRQDLSGSVSFTNGVSKKLREGNRFDSTELILRQTILEDWAINDLLHFINKLSLYHYFNLSNNGEIRQHNSSGVENHLLSNGENLNSILLKIKNNHSLVYENIERLLIDINPKIKDISFNLFGSRIHLFLREKGLSKAIPIEHISDGTLYYLLLLAIFYNPKRGKGICIDEPETGLHPDMINTIAESIKYASKETQFFIATHSPLLLNAFNLEDVLIFEKDKKNQTKVEYKSEDDFEDWDENSLVGQLWLNGQLGGKRW